MSGNIANYGSPLRVHTELMSDEQLSRFRHALGESGAPSTSLVTLPDLFVTEPELYKAVMNRFFNLQAESSDTHARNTGQYDYALHLAEVVCTGKEHELPVGIEASRKKVSEILGKLAPVMAYQRWLDQTEGLLG